MSKPLITIGITCYREGEWLRECWESVLAQTDDRWTAVMVMDGTTHTPTREIFEELSHPKLRKYASPQNLGPYPTRNKAFELTETPYHFYLDGDDQLLPESVAIVLETFEKHADAGFVYGDYDLIGSQSSTLRFPREFTDEDLLEAQPTPGPCAYKKQTWEQLGGYATELARGNGDYDFLMAATAAGIRGYHCSQVFYRYRVGHPTKVSGSYRLSYHETHEIMVRRHPEFFHDSARRNRFLGVGYRRAAIANFIAGKHADAVRLSMAACRCGVWPNRQWMISIPRGVFRRWSHRLVGKTS